MVANWQYKKIADVCSVLTDGNWIESKDQSPDGIRLIQTGNIGNGVFKDKGDKARYISEETFERLSCTEIFEGDVLVSRLPEPIGRSCILPKLEQRTVTAVDCSILRFKKDLLNKFFVYFTLSPAYDRALKNYITGSSRKRISRSNLGLIKVPVPPIEDQQRIVDELDLLTGIIDKKNAQLRDLDALAQSIFYEMFGDPITNDKGWPKRMLKQLGLVITGNTPSTKDVKNYASEDVCFFKPSDICKDSVSFLKKSEFHISSYAFEKSRKLPKGSVLITCIGIVGKVGILTESATCNQQINAILPENVESPWLAYAVFLQKKLMEEIANAPVVPIINKGDFSRIQVPVPPIEKQEQFSQALKEIECQKQMILLSKSETEKLLSCRMASYFG